MILNTSMPSSAANVNASNGVEPYIQIGLETGKTHWEMDINCPVQGILEKKHHCFTGSLHSISKQALDEIEIIAGLGRQQDIPTCVVYEAGGFGQILGRSLDRAGTVPIQLVARNIEYVRFGTGRQDIPKTDRLDSQRQSHIPVLHPDLPYADVQRQQEEDLRDLFKEHERLNKETKRLNSQMCGLMSTVLIGVRHASVSVWEKRLEQYSGISPAKTHILDNLLSELKEATQKNKVTLALLFEMTKQISAGWQPPDPNPLPAESGRHSLKPLGKNSPLRSKSLNEALLAIKGVGPKTMLTMLAFIGDPRRFKSKKAFRAYLGLAPTPWRSCSIKKSFGMKRGNPKLRKLMVQLAWRWCSSHPDTKLARKYSHRLQGTRRSRKIAVCALAGELAEMLYSYLVNGKEIEGLNVKEA